MQFSIAAVDLFQAFSSYHWCKNNNKVAIKTTWQYVAITIQHYTKILQYFPQQSQTSGFWRCAGCFSTVRASQIDNPCVRVVITNQEQSCYLLITVNLSQHLRNIRHFDKGRNSPAFKGFISVRKNFRELFWALIKFETMVLDLGRIKADLCFVCMKELIPQNFSFMINIPEVGSSRGPSQVYAHK